MLLQLHFEAESKVPICTEMPRAVLRPTIVTMRFRRKFLGEMSQRISQLGLDRCGVCDSERLLVGKRPAIIPIGGIHHERDHPRWDPEANVLFMVMLTCDLCGNVLLFDSERLVPGEQKMMVEGLTEEEELAAEESGDLED